ncbi:MAG: M64 family metallopeptidase [Flavobacterium sp.]|uniref:M64 family metallopeptidase n=1 Tax=Flavobacterium sp. TaxID=239 RepID=UPI002637D87B|nr:M64 family metallopeptidase [Flavobacterium sp.]MDD5149104.1 M64 family metallopeptidase [Flavobacterium sp.]
MELAKYKYLIFSLLGFLVISLGIVVVIYYNQPEVISSEPLTCNKILENGDAENRIDIVFFFDNVDDSEAQDYINYFLGIEPFESNKDKFNFYSVNVAPECEIQNGILICYSKSLVKSSAVCPNDYLIVLSEQSSSTRSSAYLNLMSINTATSKSVLIHEFGHVFANLADEYVPSTIPSGSKNCVSSCDKFKSEIDECNLGCSYESYYRSINSGIMRTLSTTNFGKFDEKIVEENLDEYK